MNRRGFTFLEVLLALAILALISVSLAPLLTRLAEADRRARDRAAAWRAGQSALASLYLRDPSGWDAASERHDLKWEQTASTGSVAWMSLGVLPKGGDRPLAILYAESPSSGEPLSPPPRLSGKPPPAGG